ncbi:hypothetical protein PR048_001286 [Dryococelus australis]|uniref:Uncharacterized protein n=1 Tax=Dryococelus australis TaxID=614101 RepID=A0ABQ9IIE5_9NEOP|nr:hypothetical protein PR048_001286 [Dryococelus australis]
MPYPGLEPIASRTADQWRTNRLRHGRSALIRPQVLLANQWGLKTPTPSPFDINDGRFLPNGTLTDIRRLCSVNSTLHRVRGLCCGYNNGCVLTNGMTYCLVGHYNHRATKSRDGDYFSFQHHEGRLAPEHSVSVRGVIRLVNTLFASIRRPRTERAERHRTTFDTANSISALSTRPVRGEIGGNEASTSERSVSSGCSAYSVRSEKIARVNTRLNRSLQLREMLVMRKTLVYTARHICASMDDGKQLHLGGKGQVKLSPFHPDPCCDRHQQGLPGCAMSLGAARPRQPTRQIMATAWERRDNGGWRPSCPSLPEDLPDRRPKEDRHTVWSCGQLQTLTPSREPPRSRRSTLGVSLPAAEGITRGTQAGSGAGCLAAVFLASRMVETTEGGWNVSQRRPARRVMDAHGRAKLGHARLELTEKQFDVGTWSCYCAPRGAHSTLIFPLRYRYAAKGAGPRPVAELGGRGVKSTQPYGLAAERQPSRTIRTPPHLGEPGSIPNGATPGFSHVGVVPDDATGRRVFPGSPVFTHPINPDLLHAHLAPPSSGFKASMLRATQNSSPTLYLLHFVSGPRCTAWIALSSHQGETGSIPDVASEFSHVGIVQDDAAGRGVLLDEGREEASFSRMSQGLAPGVLSRIKARCWQTPACVLHTNTRPPPSSCFFIPPYPSFTLPLSPPLSHSLSLSAAPLVLQLGGRCSATATSIEEGGGGKVSGNTKFTLRTTNFLLISIPTSVQSMSRQSQCSRVFQAPSSAVGFTRRFHTLSSLHATNSSIAIVPQSPVVLTSLRSRTLGQMVSVKDYQPLGRGSTHNIPQLISCAEEGRGTGQSNQNILAWSQNVSETLAGERRSVTPASLAAVGIHGIPRRQKDGRERIVPGRGGLGGSPPMAPDSRAGQ